MEKFFEITQNWCVNLRFNSIRIWGLIVLPTFTIDIRKDLYTFSMYWLYGRFEITLFNSSC